MKKSKEAKTTGTTVTQQHKTPSPGTVNGKVKGDSKSKEKEEKIREMERAERERLVLWRAPLKTLRYFTAESFILLYSLGERYEYVIYIEIFNAQNLELNIGPTDWIMKCPSVCLSPHIGILLGYTLVEYFALYSF